MRKLRTQSLVAFMAFYFAHWHLLSAQDRPPDPNPDKLLGDQLSSKDQTVRQQAIEAIRKRAVEHPNDIAAALRRSWLGPMAKAGFNDDIASMTQMAIFSAPGSMLTLEPMLRARVYALIALGRNDEALADARRFYNVCNLDQTGLAVDALVAAMRAKYGEDGEVKIRQFRMRQMTAAAAGEEPAAGPATDPASVQTNAADLMLLSIPLDENPYMAQVDKWKYNHKQIVAYGNLLLMAGRADEACLVFTDLLNRAKTDKELVIALERQSAAMRAQDGNPARAQGRIRRLVGNGENGL